MRYPKQKNSTKKETEYRVHFSSGITYDTPSLEDARKHYNEKDYDNCRAMITKKITVTITVETWYHVQGNL